MTKLKQFISSMLVIAITAATLAGCTSSEIFTIENGPSEGGVIVRQDSSGDEPTMLKGLTDEELNDAAKTYQSYLNNIANRFSEIWPGAKAENYHVIITNGNICYYVSNETYKEIDARHDSNLKSSFELLQYAVGLYQPVTYQKENITAMNLMKMDELCTEDDLLRNFTILMHESFHLHSQAGWQGVNVSAVENGQSNMRASAYPLDDRPRILRAMQYECLYRALNETSGTEEARCLESAKYWYERWKNEYPEEYLSIKDTDLAEGTAEYFGNEIKRVLQNGNATLTTPEEFAAECQSADAESYALGDVAIQLLKKRGDFKTNDFEKDGSTPIEVLMSDMESSKAESTNPELVSIITKNIEKTNSQVSKCFSDYISADLKGEMTYIGIDSESLTGIMSEGIYYLSEIKKTGWQNAFISNLSMQVNGKNVLEYGDSILIPVVESEITKKDSTISNIQADGIQLNVPAKFEKRTDERGNIIYQLLGEKD